MTGQDIWCQYTMVYVTSKIDRLVKLIVYCVLFVRVVIKHVTSTFLMKHSYQYKNKLEQHNVPCVKDGSEIELFTSVMVTIIQSTCIEES